MRVLYLQNADYEIFGLPESTSPDKIAAASALINAWLNRPEGLLCSDGETMDATGEPIVEYHTLSRHGAVVLSRHPVTKLLEVTWAVPPGRGTWTEEPLSSVVFEPGGRVVFANVPPGMRVCVKYLSGWTYAGLPDVVKQACALVVQSGVDLSGVPLGVKRAKAGDAELEFFGPIHSPYFPAEVSMLLGPYRRVTA